MTEQTTYTLDDDAISQIAKALQIAILTGTDIVDNLRQIKFHNILNRVPIFSLYTFFFFEIFIYLNN